MARRYIVGQKFSLRARPSVHALDIPRVNDRPKIPVNCDGTSRNVRHFLQLIRADSGSMRRVWFETPRKRRYVCGDKAASVCVRACVPLFLSFSVCARTNTNASLGYQSISPSPRAGCTICGIFCDAIGAKRARPCILSPLPPL